MIQTLDYTETRLCIQIFKHLSISLDNNLISILIFACQTLIHFSITQYMNVTDRTDAVNQISYYNIAELNRTGTQWKCWMSSKCYHY